MFYLFLFKEHEIRQYHYLREKLTFLKKDHEPNNKN